MASEINKPFLPFEIITHILTRLPIKSIVQFQSVCKQWKSLIKTKSFISQHTLHFSHENPFLLIHAYDNNYSHPTLRLLNHNLETTQVVNTHVVDSFARGWRIIDSSNGLLCVELLTEGRRFPLSYLLWNPLTNHVKEVPQIIYDYGYGSGVGFGYSSVVNDYKIVRFYHPNLLKKENRFMAVNKAHCVQMYSLSTGSWKELDIGDVRDTIILSQAANANGTIFWRGLRSDEPMLIAFDIAMEVFTITPMRPFSANMDAHEYASCPHRVYEYGNKLAMCLAIAYNMYMWVIEEGGGESGKGYSCTKRYKFGPISYGLQPLCFWSNHIVCRHDRRFERSEVEVEDKNCLHLFNHIAKEWKKFPNFSGAYDCCDIFNYEMSLVSVCYT